MGVIHLEWSNLSTVQMSKGHKNRAEVNEIEKSSFVEELITLSLVCSSSASFLLFANLGNIFMYVGVCI